MASVLEKAVTSDSSVAPQASSSSSSTQVHTINSPPQDMPITMTITKKNGTSGNTITTSFVIPWYV